MRLQRKRIYSHKVDYIPDVNYWEVYRANDQLCWRPTIELAWQDYEKQLAREKQKLSGFNTCK